MIRTIVFALALATLACAPLGENARRGTAECRDDLGFHCARVCHAEGGLPAGYLAVYPFKVLKCVCKTPKHHKPKFAPHARELVF